MHCIRSGRQRWTTTNPPLVRPQNINYILFIENKARRGGRMERPFDDVRVLDMTYDLGRYVGRLFADLGALVTRIEPPGGLPDRKSAMSRDALAREPAVYEFEFLNAGKQSRVLDLQTDNGRAEFEALAKVAQV